VVNHVGRTYKLILGTLRTRGAHALRHRGLADIQPGNPVGRRYTSLSNRQTIIAPERRAGGSLSPDQLALSQQPSSDRESRAIHLCGLARTSMCGRHRPTPTLISQCSDSKSATEHTWCTGCGGTQTPADRQSLRVVAALDATHRGRDDATSSDTGASGPVLALGPPYPPSKGSTVPGGATGSVHDHNCDCRAAMLCPDASFAPAEASAFCSVGGGGLTGVVLLALDFVGG
jgi:hypothetical protein